MVWFQPHAGSLMPGIYRRANAHLFTCGEQETRNTVHMKMREFHQQNWEVDWVSYQT